MVLNKDAHLATQLQDGRLIYNL